MRYPAYPDYTATRWPEVGKIPTGWEARRLKFSVSLRNEKIEAESNELDYMGLEHIESWTGKRIEDDAASSEGIATRFVKDDVVLIRLIPLSMSGKTICHESGSKYASLPHETENRGRFSTLLSREKLLRVLTG